MWCRGCKVGDAVFLFFTSLDRPLALWVRRNFADSVPSHQEFARCLLLHKCTIFDSTGTYPLEKSILMLYIMAVCVRPFIFKLMLTSYAAHVTLMAVLQTQKCPEGIVHYDKPWFISWWFKLTGCVLQCLRTGCFSTLLNRNRGSICVVMLSVHFWT